MGNLIVEDGTGVPDADSYNSIAELDAYMAKFGYTDWPESAAEEMPDMPESELPVDPDISEEEEDVQDDGQEETGDGDTEIEPDNPDTPVDPVETEQPKEVDPILLKKQAAARRAAIYIDSAYGTRFTGTPVNPEQGLAWPRKDAVDYFGNDIPDDKVPLAIKRAHAEVTLLAFKGTSLAAEASSGPLLKRKKIDVLEWEYDNETYGQAPIFGWVDKLLFNLLGPASEVGALEVLGIQRA